MFFGLNVFQNMPINSADRHPNHIITPRVISCQRFLIEKQNNVAFQKSQF